MFLQGTAHSEANFSVLAEGELQRRRGVESLNQIETSHLSPIGIGCSMLTVRGARARARNQGEFTRHIVNWSCPDVTDPSFSRGAVKYSFIVLLGAEEAMDTWHAS